MGTQKITNDVLISFLWISSFAACIIIAFALGVVYLFFPEIRSIVCISGVLLFIMTIIFIFHLKVLDFENSGEVVIINNYGLLHLFFKNYFTNKLELPLDKIIDYEIKKIMLQKYLIVKIKRHNEKIIQLFFSLHYLSDGDIQFIKTSFNQIKNIKYK